MRGVGERRGEIKEVTDQRTGQRIPEAEKQDTEIQKKQLVWRCTQEAEVGTRSATGLSTSA